VCSNPRAAWQANSDEELGAAILLLASVVYRPLSPFRTKSLWRWDTRGPLACQTRPYPSAHNEMRQPKCQTPLLHRSAYRRLTNLSSSPGLGKINRFRPFSNVTNPTGVSGKSAATRRRWGSGRPAPAQVAQPGARAFQPAGHGLEVASSRSAMSLWLRPSK